MEPRKICFITGASTSTGKLFIACGGRRQTFSTLTQCRAFHNKSDITIFCGFRDGKESSQPDSPLSTWIPAEVCEERSFMHENNFTVLSLKWLRNRLSTLPPPASMPEQQQAAQTLLSDNYAIHLRASARSKAFLASTCMSACEWKIFMRCMPPKETT